MRKVLFLAAILVSLSASAQTVKLSAEKKCDAVNQVKLMKIRQDKTATPMVSMLAKVAKSFDAERFRSEGIIVGAKAGDIVTLRVPLEKMDFVDNSSDIVFYSLSEGIIAPTMNNTRFDTRTDSVQAGLGLPQAYRGDGVIVGITDWGFDYTHPNFNNKDEDNFRVLRAWDQFKLSGPAPSGFTYGTEHNGREELMAAQCDTSGLYGYATHGSHVAGISAGRGINGRNMGQAPYANLLFASFRLDLVSWLDAVEWMKNVAKEEGKRLVINSSWGMYTLGPLDGTSLASQAINNYSDSGLVFVTSGGNCGDDRFHFGWNFHRYSDNTIDTIRTVADYYGSEEIGQALIFWGEPGQAFDMTFSMVRNGEATPFRWVHTADGDFYLDSALVAGTDTLPFNITVEQSHPLNGRPHVLLNVSKDRHYQIHIAFTADSGTVHAWNICNLANGAGNMGTPFSKKSIMGYVEGNNEYGIGEPACAESCITVAAHTADVRKNDSTVVLGYLADFSSHGPTLDGRHKPDVSAPGVNVVSSISSFSDETYTATMTYSYEGRKYIWSKMSGTSMSGPAVTGIVALMLQANPYLSAQQVRSILCSTARNDEHTGPLHARDSISNTWGWGKADAMAAVNAAIARLDINNLNEEFFEKSLQVYPNPASDRITVLTGRENPETVIVYSMEGRIMMQQEVSLEGQMDISTLPHGVYIVKCGARTSKLIH